MQRVETHSSCLQLVEGWHSPSRLNSSRLFPCGRGVDLLSRTWTRTPALCCQSFLACTASSAGAKTSEWLWWTISCHAPCACTSSLIWRAPRTRGERPRRKERNPSPLSKTWTFWMTFLKASPWTRTHTALWWKPCRETVWWGTGEQIDGWTVSNNWSLYNKICGFEARMFRVRFWKVSRSWTTVCCSGSTTKPKPSERTSLRVLLQEEGTKRGAQLRELCIPLPWSLSREAPPAGTLWTMMTREEPSLPSSPLYIYRQC